MARSESARQRKVGLALATSANGAARDGAALSLAEVAAGSLSVVAYSAITTSSVAATFKPQVSVDNSTWYDVKLVNNAANVATASGTGVEVTTSLALSMPDLTGWKFFRVVASLAGAATAAADKTQVDYQYRKFGTI
jgi:hypothetical protein